MPRVVCAGHVNWDVTLRVDRLPDPDGEARIRSESQSGGGSAANVAAGLAGLDTDAAVVGSVADDEHGLLARRALDRRGVDTAPLRTVEGGQTAVKYLVVAEGGEVMVLGTDGDNEAVTPADVGPAVLDGADHLHLTSQRPDTAARLAELAAERGVGVSFDPGRRLVDRDYAGPLRHADWLFLNEREAEAVADPPADLVVTKRGGSGAVVEAPGGRHRHGGFDLAAVDSTGAGDAFAAGFIAARLRGDGPAAALRVANACGALGAASEGAQVDLSWAAVESVVGDD